MSAIRALILSLLLLLGGVGPAAAAPEWRSAPEAFPERPTIEAPVGGWWTVDGAFARVHAPYAERVTAERLADHAARAVPRLSAALGVPAGGLVDIYLADDEAFARIQPYAPPDWADGTAWPLQGLIFLHLPSSRPGTAAPLEQVLDHELVHVLVGRAFSPHRPPRWLQEGVAQVYAGEVGPGTTELLGRAEVFGGLMSLDALAGGWPADPVRAQLAYAQSADVVAHLRAEYGEDAVRRLIAGLSGGAGFEAALARATGADLATVEAGWLERWDDPWAFLRLFGDGTLLLGLGGAVVVVGAWRRQRRARAKLARWEREEEERLLREQEAHARRMRLLAWSPRLVVDGGGRDELVH